MEWYWIVLISLAAVAVLYVIFAFFVAKALLKKAVLPRANTLAEAREFQVKQENWDFTDYDVNWNKRHFTVKTFDNLTLDGEVVFNPAQSKRPKTAVICHGHTWNRITSLKYADIFYRLGYNIVIYDNRYFGLSEGLYTTLGQNERRDLASVLEYVRRLFGENCFIALHGESMGAATVLSALSSVKADLVVADCPFSDTFDYFKELTARYSRLPAFPIINFSSLLAKHKYKYDYKSVSPVKDVAASGVPICLIHGDADKLIDCAHSRKLFAASKNPDSELHIFDGAQHARCFLKDREKYRSAVSDFVRKIESKSL